MRNGDDGGRISAGGGGGVRGVRVRRSPHYPNGRDNGMAGAEKPSELRSLGFQARMCYRYRCPW